MPILPERRLAFVHIPKCAGTSIEVSLGWADRYPGIGFEPTTTEPDHEHLFGGGLQHLTAREIVRRRLGEAFREYYAFSVVRDPLDRLASHFLWRTFRFAPPGGTLEEARLEFGSFVLETLSRYESHPAFRRPEEGYVHDPSDDSSGLAPNDVDRHLLPQCAYLFSGGELIVRNLFTLERLPDLVGELRRRVPGCRALERRMVSKSRWRSRDLFTEEAERAARQLYAEDRALYRRLADAGGWRAEGRGEPTAEASS